LPVAFRLQARQLIEPGGQPGQALIGAQYPPFGELPGSRVQDRRKFLLGDLRSAGDE